jgi:hypothetical protein
MRTLIDTLLPRWDLREVHGIDVAAPPERTWAALQQVTVGELPLTRLLMKARGLLADAPGERVAGMAGRPPRAARRRAERA